MTPRPSPAAVAAAYRDLARRYVADLAEREAELAAAEVTIGKLSAALAHADQVNRELHACIDVAFEAGWNAHADAHQIVFGVTEHADAEPQPGWAPHWMN